MASTAESKDKSGGDADCGNEITFQAPDCPVEKVTVYPDRAEVCRRMEGSLAVGLNQVVIKKLPDMVDPDSIRVEGKGEATIIEVVFHSESVPKDESDRSGRERDLEAEKEFLQKQSKDLESELSVLKKQWTLLDGFATTASKGATGAKEGEATGLELNEKFFKGLKDFLQLYSEEGNGLERKQLELEKRQVSMEEKIKANAHNIKKLRDDQSLTNEIKKCIIVVECKEASKVSLLVSYVTSSASWKPSYDIRMFTAEDKLKITYYGQIQQSTGEDWNNAKLFLSTAMPSVGGEVPDLLTAELRLRKPRSSSAFARIRSFRLKSYSLGTGFDDDAATAGELVNSGMADVVHSAMRSPLSDPSISAATASVVKVGEGVATTMFEITRPSTIPCDNVEHKVTVGMVDIKPKISYTTVPQRVLHAFMLAKVTNSSPYTFLSGETSIFLDNTFVGKASMKDVYPMEEFECSLGVDPAVKITYKPQKKYRSSSGLISKVTSNTHEQVIEIKNTHDYGIEIQVTDQLPRSTDDRIKVHLLEPQIDLKHPEKSKDKDVTLNKNNNLEWYLELKKQEVKEISLKYTVEHPASFNIYTNEVQDKA